MMGWTANDEVLATGRYSAAPDYRVETEANEATETFDFPELNTGAGDDFEIVRTAAENWLTNLPAPVMSADSLWENLSDGDADNDPVIVSVRKPEHYELGHIPGAINIPWKNIADPANLAMLPADKQIVVYCYTGHTGQVAATVLGILGYDAINLKFGMMGWTADDEVLATARYSGAPDYRLEPEAVVAQPISTDAEPVIAPATGAPSLWVYVLPVVGVGLLMAGLVLRRSFAR
jgi:rhodanese-related sulfurtransferase